MPFHIGQQVVCVDTDFSRNPSWRSKVQALPERNAVYTIRDICEEDGLIGLYLHEIVNPPAFFLRGLDEPAFLSTRFRPVRKTSIAVFEKILLSANGKVGSREREPV